MKELRESQTTVEFLENENNTLTERASKAEGKMNENKTINIIKDMPL